MIVFVKLTTAGSDTGNFTITDNFVNVIATGVSRVNLLAGITYSNVNDNATFIKIQSDSGICSNYITLLLPVTTTTTTTTSTTTTTTTISEGLSYYLAMPYPCDTCTAAVSSVLVSLPSSHIPVNGNFYVPVDPDGNSYLLGSSPQSPGPAVLLTIINYLTCGQACI